MRERFGGSVSRLAEACDVSVQLAAKWVSENPRQRVNPSPSSCEKIAEGLRFDTDYILGLAGHRRQRELVGTPPDPHWSAFLTEIEVGWRAMDERTRELAERTARALFSVSPGSKRQNGNGPVIDPYWPRALALA